MEYIKPDKKNLHSNNFDMLRLFAASQVAFLHIAKNLDIKLEGFLLVLKDFLQYFPGVPIFFVISGFLISSSFERNPSIRYYIINRVLRIYPALWVSTIITLILVNIFGDKVWQSIQQTDQSSVVIVAKWLLSQLTFAQFYNPFIMKNNYGVGHLNGSLWTIPVELQFYVFLPLIAKLLYRNHPRKIYNFRLIFAILILYIITYLYLKYQSYLMTFSEDISLLFRISLLPYLYMFMLGIILQINHQYFSRLINGKGIIWLGMYIAAAYVLKEHYGIKHGTNTPNLLSMTLLSVTVVSIAFTNTTFSKNILKGTDISYGIYIYHMIIANLIFELGFEKSTYTLCAVLIVTYLIAMLSWLLIERPALRLKHKPLLCCHQ